MTLSVLLIESDAAHASASAEAMADEQTDWRVEVAHSVAEARAALALNAFDVIVVSHRLADGTAFDLGALLAGQAVILSVAPGEEQVAAQAMRLGFGNHIVKDAGLAYVPALALRVAMARRDADTARHVRQSAERFEFALDGAGLGLWERHLITGKMFVNERWRAILGYQPDEITVDAEVWQGLVHPDDWSEVLASSRTYMNGQIPMYQCEYRMRHKLGHWLWVLSRGRVMERDASGMALRLLGTLMDITQSRQNREASERQHRLLQAISRAQSLFITTIDAKTVFENVLRDLLAITGSTYGFVGEVLFDADQQPCLTIQSTAALALDEASRQLDETLAEGVTYQPLRQTLLGAALALGEPVMSNDPARDPRWDDDDQARGAMNAFMGIPIHNDGELVAMVGLANRPEGYSQADVDLLDPLCNTIGQLVQARRSDAERRRVQRELEKTSEQLVEKTRALRTTLDSIAQGICTTEADGRSTVFNRRYVELLELPESLMARQPTLEEVVAFQRARGDFGEANERVDARGQAYMARGGAMASPDRYSRKTRSGRALEIETKLLPSGGMVRTFTDVTDYVQAQAALSESENRFRSLTELSSDWYWEQDEQFRFVRIEGSQESRVGMENMVSVGLTRWDLTAYNLSEAQWEAHRQQLRAHQVFKDFEMERRSADGEAQWVSISGTPIFDETGAFRGYRGVGSNITERKKAESKIERLAFFDELTGLPNRRLLTNRLQKALAASARNSSRGALLFIDLDNFKDLNDTQGHDVGDLLLQQVASRLRQCVREIDTVARLGGDEFIVMLDELSQNETQAAAQAEQVGRKILSALNQHFELLGHHHHSTPSIGITLFHDQLQSVDELLKRADLAMYQSKAAGRNTLCFFDPEMQAAATTRAALEADLRQGLQREELLLYYQPMVDAHGQITGVEALVRWQHPQRGLVAPMEFIPIAEQTGLIFPLGEWVLKTACQQLVSWSEHSSTRQLSIAVNVSARQFRQSEFVEQVRQLLRQSGANPFRLKLELTESLLLSDMEDAIDKMSQLRAIGVSFSLDDFGTGYSSLSYLKRLPLDQLKIDQTFVRDVLTDPNDAAIVRTILALARSMELTVVAEGVETQGQREFLAYNGCRVFQGYLFGRPVPVEMLELASLAPVGDGPIPFEI
jgi:diguanylate cyclase (GGDEF)-like protein/PAS domain S-box-containing protein